MENATKALLMAGGVLIAILIISIAVFLFTTYGSLGQSYEQTLSKTEIQKFNGNFTKFEGREDISIQEIVTLTNFVRDYNIETDEKIEIKLGGENLEKETSDELAGKVKDNMGKTYKAIISSYSRLVEKITFMET